MLGQMNPMEKSRQSLQEGLKWWGFQRHSCLLWRDGKQTCWEVRNWELRWEGEAGAALLALGEQRSLGSPGAWILSGRAGQGGGRCWKGTDRPDRARSSGEPWSRALSRRIEELGGLKAPQEKLGRCCSVGNLTWSPSGSLGVGLEERKRGTEGHLWDSCSVTWSFSPVWILPWGQGSGSAVGVGAGMRCLCLCQGWERGQGSLWESGRIKVQPNPNKAPVLCPRSRRCRVQAQRPVLHQEG